MSGLWCTALLLAIMQLPGQKPPWTPNPNEPQRPPEVEHHLPGDEPPQPGQPAKLPRIDTSQAKRDAEELVKLAVRFPRRSSKPTKVYCPKT